MHPEQIEVGFTFLDYIVTNVDKDKQVVWVKPVKPTTSTTWKNRKYVKRNIGWCLEAEIPADPIPQTFVPTVGQRVRVVGIRTTTARWVSYERDWGKPVGVKWEGEVSMVRDGYIRVRIPNAEMECHDCESQGRPWKYKLTSKGTYEKHTGSLPRWDLVVEVAK